MAYLADSVASAPPPLVGPPLIPPPRASTVPASNLVPGGGANLAGGSDFDDDAAPAFVSSAPGSDAAPAAAPLFGAAADDDGPPIDQLEAEMRGELASRDVSAPASDKPSARRAAHATARDAEDETERSTAPLPELDTLVARLPAEVRETLDELFRTRFVNVKRIPKSAIQADPTKVPSAAPPLA